MVDRSTTAGGRAPLRPWMVGVSVAFALAAGGLVVDSAKSVDISEVTVLADFLAEALPGVKIAALEASDRSPCWWWCEDYQLRIEMRVELANDPSLTPAQRCDQISGLMRQLIGEDPEPIEGSGEHLRACYFAWYSVPYHRRDLLVGVIVWNNPDSPIQVHVENESAHRAVLPWVPFG